MSVRGLRPRFRCIIPKRHSSLPSAENLDTLNASVGNDGVSVCAAVVDFGNVIIYELSAGLASTQ